MIVVDASLVAKWFLPEADSELAGAFLVSYAHKLIAPDLIAIEVAAALVRRANENKALMSYVDASLDDWRQMLTDDEVMLFRSTAVSIRESARLATTLGHAMKDSIYLQLAREHDCDFVTCDAKFAAKATVVFPRVKLLGEFMA